MFIEGGFTPTEDIIEEVVEEGVCIPRMLEAPPLLVTRGAR
jgi:hypothetical protein